MDELSGALDAIAHHMLEDELQRIRRETCASVMFVPHDLDEAIYLADTVMLLGGGPARIVRKMAASLPRPRRRDAVDMDAQVGSLRHALSETFTEGSRI